MRLDQNPVASVTDPYGDDRYGANGRGGVGEGGFALGELEPEVVDVLGAGLDAPGGEGVGGEAGTEPVGEGLGVGEVVAAASGEGHGGDFEETARAKWETENLGFGEEGLSAGGGGGEEEADGESSEEEIW